MLFCLSDFFPYGMMIVAGSVIDSNEKEVFMMYHVIINPASRSGKGLKLWKEVVEPLLHKEGVAYRSYFSRESGDVARLAAEITTAEHDTENLTLIILGGDGTVNEALQGIADTSRVTLGYIPTGSSNDFARDLNIPKDPAEALNRILHTGTVHTMDMGTLTYPDGFCRRFAVSCGIGFDAAVCEESLRSRIKAFCNKIGLGKLTYLGIALKQLLGARRVSCDLELDGQPPVHIRNLLFIACMNHRYEGGGFLFAPKARDNDGIMNLCVVGDIPKLVILFALPTAYFGAHYIFKGVTPYKASRIRIRASRPLWMHTDGEVLPQTSEFTAECCRDALKVIY